MHQVEKRTKKKEREESGEQRLEKAGKEEKRKGSREWGDEEESDGERKEKDQDTSGRKGNMQNAVSCNKFEFQ